MTDARNVTLFTMHNEIFNYVRPDLIIDFMIRRPKRPERPLKAPLATPE